MTYIEFSIRSEHHDLSNITSLIGTEPTYLFKKGEEQIACGKTIIYNDNCWSIKKEINEINEEAEIFTFVDFLYCKKDIIKELTKIHTVYLWITLYPDSYQYNLYLSEDILKMLGEMDIALNVTSMQLQELYCGQFRNNTK